jgi:hypothetical protein
VISSIFIDGEGRLRSGWRFLLALITLFAAFFIGEAVARGLSGNVAVRNMINRLVSAVIMLVVFLWMSRTLDHAADAATYVGLGVHRPWLRDLAAGCLLGALLVSTCVAVIAIAGGYHIAPGPALAVHRWAAAAIVAWILIFGALTEELGFRSYPFLRLIEALSHAVRSFPSALLRTRADSIGAWMAILLLSCLFGAVHLGNPNATFFGVANTVLIGIFFGMLMVRTGSLWLLWGVHFGWNFTLGTLFGLPVSGIDQFSVLWTGRASGGTWLTGGAYGIEASATATAVIALAIMAVAWFGPKTSAVAASGIQPE